MRASKRSHMQGSSHYKIHEKSCTSTRNLKGKKKPVAIRQAKKRLKQLKRKFSA